MSRRCSLLRAAGSNRDRRCRPTVLRPQLATRGQTPKHGVPRTRKGAIGVGEALGSDVVQEMKELALRSRPAGGGFKPPPAALAEDRRGERGGKGARDASGGDQEDGAQPLAGGVAVDVSLRRDDIETGAVFRAPGGAWRVPADWPGGVRHEGGASAAQALVWNVGKAPG